MITPTKKSSIFLIILSTFIVASGQFFLKKGVEKGFFPLISLFSNIPLITGAILYVIGAILLIISLKGGELSVLYPLFSLTYIWVIGISLFYFNEPVAVLKLTGIASIMVGVGILGVNK